MVTNGGEKQGVMRNRGSEDEWKEKRGLMRNRGSEEEWREKRVVMRNRGSDDERRGEAGSDETGSDEE